MSTLKDRLIEIIEKKGTSIGGLEVSLGLPNSFIRKYIKGEKEDLGQKTLEKILKQYPDINPTWLLTGLGDMLIPSPSVQLTPIGNGKIVLKNGLMVSTTILPFEALAGLPVPTEIGEIMPEAALVPGISFRVQFLIKVKGDSMEPEIKDGEILIITPVLPGEVEQGKIYVIHTQSGETLVKFVDKDPVKKIYFLRSMNLYYAPRAMEESELSAFYRVIAKIGTLYD